MGTRNRQPLSASLEDYLEAIFNLAGESREARSKDIAEALGVARSSVTGALQILKERGLANYEPYGCITLTRQGQTAAREVVRKHDVLKAFFTDVLGGNLLGLYTILVEPLSEEEFPTTRLVRRIERLIRARVLKRVTRAEGS